VQAEYRSLVEQDDLVGQVRALEILKSLWRERIGVMPWGEQNREVSMRCYTLHTPDFSCLLMPPHCY